jgi:hypothetical protein
MDCIVPRASRPLPLVVCCETLVPSQSTLCFVHSISHNEFLNLLSIFLIRFYCIPLCLIFFACSRIYSIQFLYFINFLHGNHAITRTQRSFIEYIQWSWIQLGISCLVRLVKRYVEQIQPTKLTSQTVSQEMNRSTI